MNLHYGKYRGCDVRDVPTQYLQWLLKEARATLEAVEAELERRSGPRLAQQAKHPWVERTISAGYRVLAKQHHPDMGGDQEAMRQLNAAVAMLRELVDTNGNFRLGDSAVEPSGAVRKS